MPHIFELSRDDRGAFHFRLTSPDGRTLLRSEAYTAKASAKKGIEAVRANATAEGRLLVLTASDGRPYVNLKAANGQIVATSPMFLDQDACEAAIEAIRAFAAGADLVDNA